MAVGEASTDFHPVPGVRLASVPCGLKKGSQPDLVLFEFAPGSVTAGIFTRSKFAAAPVQVGRRHLRQKDSRYFLVNSGNANAATGEQGASDAEACCRALSQYTGALPEEIIPFSTGVIGERLQISRIIDALPSLTASLNETNWLAAATGIMTTDTRPKISTRQFEMDGATVTITGIAKGAGMIQPNMATLLAYIATDALCSRAYLKESLLAAAEKSFNRITVDGDTSTNDACMLTATGASGVEVEDKPAFTDALTSLMQELAQGIIRDAEGASRFVAVTVRGGKSSQDCLAIAYSIANSPLVKTALFAGDANWGRIIMAIGKADAEMDINRMDVFLDDVRLVHAGGRDETYTEEAGARVMAQEEITITVDLNLADVTETVWTSDLSHDYVSINADYRT